MHSLGNLLRLAYQRAGSPTISHLARDAGVPRPNLSRALSGQQETTPVLLGRVLDHLGWDLELVPSENSKKKKKS